MRRSGVIPPGRAGLIMLAVAFVPVALAACKPLARGLGKALKKAGEMAERIADNSQIAEKEEPKATTATEDKKAEPKAAAPKKTAPKKPAAKKTPPKSKPADASA